VLILVVTRKEGTEMRKSVFDIKQSLILYTVIVVSFYFTSIAFFKAFDINGIPLTHFFTLFLPGILVSVLDKKDIREVYLLRKPSASKYIYIGFGLWVAVLIISGIYSVFAVKLLPEEAKLLEAFDYLFSNLTLTYQLVVIAAIPAVVEELLFRGLFLSSFLEHMKPLRAMVFTSLMFAVMHFSLLKMFPTFMLGMVFAYTVYRTNSILPAIALHFINNGFSVVGTYFLLNTELETGYIFSVDLMAVIITASVSLVFIKTSQKSRGLNG
jgi:sodium transport system permease protein